MLFRSCDDLKGLTTEQLCGGWKESPNCNLYSGSHLPQKTLAFFPLSGGKNKLLEQFAPGLKMNPLLPLYVRYKIPEPVSPPPAGQFMGFLKSWYVQESHKVRSQCGSNSNPTSYLRNSKLALETEKWRNDYQTN